MYLISIALKLTLFFCKSFWRAMVTVFFFSPFFLLMSKKFPLPAEHVLGGESKLLSVWEREVFERGPLGEFLVLDAALMKV